MGPRTVTALDRASRATVGCRVQNAERAADPVTLARAPSSHAMARPVPLELGRTLLEKGTSAAAKQGRRVTTDQDLPGVRRPCSSATGRFASRAPQQRCQRAGTEGGCNR